MPAPPPGQDPDRLALRDAHPRRLLLDQPPRTAVPHLRRPDPRPELSTQAERERPASTAEQVVQYPRSATQAGRQAFEPQGHGPGTGFGTSEVLEVQAQAGEPDAEIGLARGQHAEPAAADLGDGLVPRKGSADHLDHANRPQRVPEGTLRTNRNLHDDDREGPPGVYSSQRRTAVDLGEPCAQVSSARQTAERVLAGELVHVCGGLLRPGNPECTRLPEGRSATGRPFSGRPQLVQRLTQVGALTSHHAAHYRTGSHGLIPTCGGLRHRRQAVRKYSDPPRICAGAQGPGGGPPPLRESAPHSDPPPPAPSHDPHPRGGSTLKTGPPQEDDATSANFLLESSTP